MRGGGAFVGFLKLSGKQSSPVKALRQGTSALLSEWSDGFAKHVACLQKRPLLGSLFLLVNKGTIFIHCIEVFTTSTRKTWKFMTTMENKQNCVKER
jgi:hypothetical protein